MKDNYFRLDLLHVLLFDSLLNFLKRVYFCIASFIDLLVYRRTKPVVAAHTTTTHLQTHAAQ